MNLCFIYFFYNIYNKIYNIYFYTDNNKYWENNRLSFIFFNNSKCFCSIKNFNYRLIQFNTP